MKVASFKRIWLLKARQPFLLTGLLWSSSHLLCLWQQTNHSQLCHAILHLLGIQSSRNQ